MAYNAKSGVSDLPRAPIKRILKGANENGPVGADAVEELTKILVDFGTQIGTIANKFAVNDGRKTILARDMRAALSL